MNFFTGFEPKFQTKFKGLLNSSNLSRSWSNLSLTSQPPPEKELNIAKPTDVQHHYKAFFNKATGKIEGLPPEMRHLLKDAEREATEDELMKSNKTIVVSGKPPIKPVERKNVHSFLKPMTINDPNDYILENITRTPRRKSISLPNIDIACDDEFREESRPLM